MCAYNSFRVSVLGKLHFGWWLTCLSCLLGPTTGLTAAQLSIPAESALWVMLVSGPHDDAVNPPSEVVLADTASTENLDSTQNSDSSESADSETVQPEFASAEAASTDDSQAGQSSSNEEAAVSEAIISEVADQKQIDESAASGGAVSPERPPHPLSVEPSIQMLPKDRPSWIDAEPETGTDIHRFVVASIPTALKSELDSNLDATLEAALKAYASQQFSPDAGELLRERLTAAFIRTNLIDENKTYIGEMRTGEGPLFQKWVMVEVTPKQRDQMRHWHSEQLQRQRVLPLGLGLAGLFTVIALTHLALRRRVKVPPGLKETQATAGKAMGNVPPVELYSAQVLQSKPKCRRSALRKMAVILPMIAVIAVPMLVTSSTKSSQKRKVKRKKDVVEVQVLSQEECAAQSGSTIQISRVTRLD